MLNNSYPGLFAAVEGLDGSGKSSQVSAVARHLSKTGKNAFITFEPSGSAVGNLIRACLLGERQSSPLALQLLFAADRAQHLDKEIIPRLKKGDCVITDRYAFSSFAYGAVENDLDWLIDINSRFLEPDLVIYMEASPEACIERIKTKRTSVELFEKTSILKEVARNYEVVFKRKEFKKISFVNVDSGLGIDINAVQISTLIDNMITKKAAQTAAK